VANGHDTKRVKPGARVDRTKLRQIDLHWHDLRHEGACRLLADGVDIRIIQLMLGHASVQQTQRYLNVTDEELRRGLEVSWKRRALKVVGVTECHTCVTRGIKSWCALQDSNLRPPGS
jgi:integrase